VRITRVRAARIAVSSEPGSADDRNVMSRRR
jgi:hypothetical protein